MASPIPVHLPRQQDVSSKILSMLDEVTSQSLNTSLASSWLAELDQTIHLTKKRIYERVHVDLPSFERQVLSSKLVQERLQSLVSNVDNLSDKLSNLESGLVPTVTKALSSHGALAQSSMNATILHASLFHLQRCRTEFESLSSLVQAGKLPETVETCRRLSALLDEAPTPLNQADIIDDMKRKLRTIADSTEEQLSDAYSKCIAVSSSDIIIRTCVQIRQSDTILHIASVLSSLSSPSLTSHLTTLRRDITTHYVDHILNQPCSIAISSDSEDMHTLSQFPSPPNSENLISRLENMSTILNFLQTNLFPSLPSSQKAAWLRSLCKPLTTSILHRLLIPSLPSSLSRLPAFLELATQAADFEEKYIIDILGNTTNDREIKTWVDGVGGHYERKRRMEILESARITIISPDDGEAFMAEVVMETGGEVMPESVPVQTEVVGVEDTAWGLDEETKTGTEENGWGFDDEDVPEPEAELETLPETVPKPPGHEEDPADAWGWNDEESSPVDDDPWAEELNEPSRPPAAPSIPQAVTRLDRSSPRTNGTSVSAPIVSSQTVAKAPSKETYLVSGRTKKIVRLVEETLAEGQKFTLSHLITSSLSPGTLIMQSALSILDLYRALFPVTFGSHFMSSAELAMRFSNDCLYLSREAARLDVSIPWSSPVKENLEVCRKNFEILSDSWFDDTIEQYRQAVTRILECAKGFVDTGEQDRYDECESAIMQVLRKIRLLASQWKRVLPKSKYYVALGSVVDMALSRILGDVLALPDILEVESHRLSELCKIMNALEGLFVEDTEQPSFVVAYVPSWLKYSYLSELLEASIADISYLFQAGALIDFDVEELVKLVRALFADTPLRATTINKLMSGHPVLEEG